MKILSLKKRKQFRSFLIDLLESHESKAGKMTGHLLIIFISISILFFILKTTNLGQEWLWFFHIFDVFMVSIFSLEYVGRRAISTKKGKFMTSPLAIIDLIVILAFHASFLNIVFLRGFRVLKIFQLLKIVRYSDVLYDFFKAFKSYRNEVQIFSVTFLLVMILSASGLYFLEKDVNPDFATIPDALWWAIVSVSTVGYGDAVPITVGGRFLAGGVMLMGLATIAIMTAIITKIFIDHFFGKRNHVCVFCHFPRHDYDAKFCKNCGNELDAELIEQGIRIQESSSFVKTTADRGGQE